MSRLSHCAVIHSKVVSSMVIIHVFCWLSTIETNFVFLKPTLLCEMPESRPYVRLCGTLDLTNAVLLRPGLSLLNNNTW